MDIKRLDKELLRRGLVSSRSQAESFIKLGTVTVNGKIVTKPGFLVGDNDAIELKSEQYVSRAGLKLASVAKALDLDFRGKVMLDVGSSTGGFTDYALQHGVDKVIAVDVGTDQLHPSLLGDPKIELHEKTDIRDFTTTDRIDIVVMDVSFVSVRLLLPHIASIVPPSCEIVVMLKPQFEAGKHQINKGVIKNDTVRRQVIKDFELWAKDYFIIVDKADSQVAGSKGNLERFYKLRPITAS